jgi:hypothetical protein
MYIFEHDNKRNSRGRKVHLEYLDARIVPAAVHPTLAVAADVAGVHSEQHRENTVADESAIQIRHEQRIAKLEERREAALERRAALYAARHHITLAAPAQNQVIAAASTNSTPATTEQVTSASAQGTSGSSASSSGTGSSVGSATNGSFVPTTPVTTTGSSSPANPLPANVSTLFDTVYEEYENGTLPASTGQHGQVEIQGSDVGVQIQTSNSSDFNTLVADAESLGLQVTDSSAAYNMVVGFLPISALPSAAQLPGSPSITPLLYPLTN